MTRVPFFAPRYNIAPTQMTAVIYMERHEPAEKLMRWVDVGMVGLQLDCKWVWIGA